MKKHLLFKSLLLLCALIVGTSAWAAEGDEITSIANIVDGKSYYIKGVRTSNTYYLAFTDAAGSQSGTESSTKNGAQLITFHLQSTGESNKVFTLETSSGKFIAPGTSNGKINVSASGVNVTATNQSSKIRLSIVSGTNTWSIQKNVSSANFGGYKNTQTDITLIEGPAASAVAKPTISGLQSFLSSTEVSISCATTDATIQYSTNGGTTWNNYSTAFTLTETTTVQAKATKSGLTDSEVASKTFTKTTAKTVAEALTAINALEDNGTISGYYVKGIVSTAGSLSSGKITYSISDDGTTASELKVYSGKGLNDAFFTSADDIQVGDKVTVYGTVKKYVSGTTTTPEFDTGNYLYSIIKKPTFSPVAGAVAAGTAVTINSTLDGATIYYTTNGTAPTTSSSVYSSPIIVNDAMTIKAIAVKDGYPESSVAEATYTIAEPCATPAFTVAAGAYSAAQSVEITCATDGATIHYTLDGTEPTASSTTYSSAISISTDKTIKAIAVKDGHANSDIAEASYTFYAALPFNYDGNGLGTLPIGLSQSGLTDSYKNSPKMKFDNTGDYLILKINEVPGTLSFAIKGNSYSSGSTSTFKVQTSADGESYTDIATYTELGDEATKTFNIAGNVRYIKWIYTEKGATNGGNVGLGNINLTKTNTITLAEACTDGAMVYGTYSCSKAFVVPNDLVVSEITVLKGKLWVENYNSGDIVPANTGVMVAALAGGNYDVTLSDEAGSSIFDSDNMLKPSGDAGITAANMTEADTKFYRLTMHNGSEIGFWWGAADGAAFDLAANKAYLAVPNSAQLSREGLWFGDDVTAIENVEVQKVDGQYFNLAGQRVANPTKGLYIVNGRKVVVK